MPPASTKKPAAKKEEQRVEGHGKFWFPNGDIYIGDYYEEGPIRKRHGKGRYTMHCQEDMEDPEVPEEIRSQDIPARLPQDIVALDGTWDADAFIEGTLRFASGAFYTGKIDREGFYVSGGRYTWPDGSWYEGDISRNILHGHGKYYSSHTDTVTEGAFRNNHGPGLDERYASLNPCQP